MLLQKVSAYGLNIGGVLAAYLPTLHTTCKNLFYLLFPFFLSLVVK
jgi:esterase/lipase